MLVFRWLQDKTFGLKNKKGKKQQQFIKNVTQQVKYGGQSMQKVFSSHSISVWWPLIKFVFLYSPQKEAEAYQAKVCNSYHSINNLGS